MGGKITIKKELAGFGQVVKAKIYLTEKKLEGIWPLTKDKKPKINDLPLWQESEGSDGAASRKSSEWPPTLYFMTEVVATPFLYTWNNLSNSVLRICVLLCVCCT